MIQKIKYILIKGVIFLLLILVTISCDNNLAKSYKIGFVNCFDNDLWRISMVNSMKVEASLHPEINLEVFETINDVDLQYTYFKYLIDNDYDVIIISPLDSELVVPLIEEAKSKDIPVILIDRKAKTNAYTTFIGADNYEVGELAAKYIASSSNGKANVVEVYVSPKTSVGYERSSGFNNWVIEYPNIKVVDRILAADIDNHREEIKLAVKNIPDIDYFFVFNDLLAREAWEIAQNVDPNNSIKFIGVDGLNVKGRGIDLVKQRILDATILYPTGGQEAIRSAIDLLEGKTIPKEIKLNTTVINTMNADIMENQLSKIENHKNDIEKQQLKLKELDETFSSQTNVLRIVVFLLITSLILGVISIISVVKLRKRKKELEIKNKKVTIQRNQIKKIAEEVRLSNEAKVNFFTGLSHEFKTPLTLILSSTESLSENKAIRENKLVSDISLIYNNSKRLLRLINQLLDFRKIEGRKFVLKAFESNLFQFSNNIFQEFKREAIKRNIDFNLTTNDENVLVYFDQNLMDKVYFNLLSNAFKFTPNNGKISIHIENDFKANEVSVTFKDSGIGIPSKELENVFTAFFQGSNNIKSSSGIGLHLSKEFIDLHHGSIEVKSLHGTQFIIHLKKGKSHLSSDEIVYEPDIIDSIGLSEDEVFEDDTYAVLNQSEDDDRYSILIIEDNPDLTKYLFSKFSKEYIVYVSDGFDAIDLAIEHIPDIITCDVNLPNMSGFEICETLKNDLRTSHIPTIILTAQESNESYVKGLESGADMYLTKPFSFSILSQSIKTLIYNREKLRYYFVNNVHSLNEMNNFGSLDQEFISNVNRIINDNIDNSKFSVEQLAGELSISRIQLYRKMKAIVGINISDYIQKIRLEKAQAMLVETQLTISEIAYATGFSTPNYFSTSFRAKYNMSPKSYRDNIKK